MEIEATLLWNLLLTLVILPFGYFFNKNLTRKYVSNNINYEFKANNSRIKRELDNKFTPLIKTVEDTFESIINSGEI